MKIVYINTLYHPLHVGGAEKSVQLLAEAMVALGHDAHVITLVDGVAEETPLHNGVVVHRIPLRNLYWPDASISRHAVKRLAWHLVDMFNFRARQDVTKALREIAPDVVHTNGLSGFSVSVWSAARRLRQPIVHSARDYYLIHPNAKLYSRGKVQRADSLTCRTWSAIKKLKSRKVDGFISISDYVKNLHLNAGFFSRARSTTIYNPIKIPVELVPKASSPWIYGYLGRLDESKGLELLLEAFARLGDDQSRLLIAGRGDAVYEAKLKRLAGQRVLFLGHVRPEEFFPMIDSLVTPSLWAEPLGRVVLEAYAYGVPVVGSDAGGIPEIIEVGRTGMTFSNGNADDLHRCLLAVRNLPKMQVLRDCRAKAERFSSETIVTSYARFYEEIIDSYAVERHD